jgi:hypothetical protein
MLLLVANLLIPNLLQVLPKKISHHSKLTWQSLLSASWFSLQQSEAQWQL